MTISSQGSCPLATSAPTGFSAAVSMWMWAPLQPKASVVSTPYCTNVGVFFVHFLWDNYIIITYLPHKAVAEVSKDKEPIGRECAEFNWFESQLMSDSNELRVK